MQWKCNNCGETLEVTNGMCKACGPVQTTPMDEEAMRESTATVGVEPTPPGE